MISKSDVIEEFDYRDRNLDWGYGSTLPINGVDVPVKWLEHVNFDADYTTIVKVGFAIEIDGKETIFVKEGKNISHYGLEWDGACYEATPIEVTYTDYERVW